MISGEDNGSASIVQNFVSCIVGYNSKPVWWNNVITDKNRHEWFDVEYTDENFIDYEEISLIELHLPQSFRKCKISWVLVRKSIRCCKILWG